MAIATSMSALVKVKCTAIVPRAQQRPSSISASLSFKYMRDTAGTYTYFKPAVWPEALLIIYILTYIHGIQIKRNIFNI